MSTVIDSMVTWATPGALMPTVAGYSPGVVGIDGSRTTTQCQVCHRTATGETFWAVKAINFAPDEGEAGHLTYRRCQDCQAARRHVGEQAAS